MLQAQLVLEESPSSISIETPTSPSEMKAAAQSTSSTVEVRKKPIVLVTSVECPLKRSFSYSLDHG
jgi:hypothetical protein